ncbi:MAG TPA: hypothetical protein VGH65_00445 [Verrucomicrobiaceae bacterium]
MKTASLQNRVPVSIGGTSGNSGANSVTGGAAGTGGGGATGAAAGETGLGAGAAAADRTAAGFLTGLLGGFARRGFPFFIAFPAFLAGFFTAFFFAGFFDAFFAIFFRAGFFLDFAADFFPAFFFVFFLAMTMSFLSVRDADEEGLSEFLSQSPFRYHPKMTDSSGRSRLR